ncbi:hypothetical protein ACFV2H_30235 [Streptomyces sp. NPDC059629]|uniref:hypothetical protein n=1 Tax=Streptomyces sp. NPDC059629 TaxID=3346889 RepID=UPI00368F478A
MSAEHRMTIRALRSTAQRIRHLQAEARELEKELLQLVGQQAPELTGATGAWRTWSAAGWSCGGYRR